MGVKTEKKASLGFPYFSCSVISLRKQESQRTFIDVVNHIIDIFRCLDPFAYVCFEFRPSEAVPELALFVLIDRKRTTRLIRTKI